MAKSSPTTLPISIHSAIVHFPIALVTLSVSADFFGTLTGNPTLFATGRWSLLAAALGAAVAVGAGLFDMNRAHAQIEHAVHERVHKHMKVGFTVLTAIAGLTVWRWLLLNDPSWGYLFIAGLVLGLTLFQAYLGGHLVYTDGVNVLPATKQPGEAKAAHANRTGDHHERNRMKEQTKEKHASHMQNHDSHAGMSHADMHHYRRLLIMAVLSFISMYILMYAMVDILGNVYANFNQFYMAGLMISPMIVIELALMGMMYENKRLNTIIVAASVVAGLAFFLLIRGQAAIADKQFLRSMIPHHAAAILMCQRASISDPEIEELCGNIISSQQSEIDQMKVILDRLEK